ncbi:MAG: hypothetical protein ABSG32_09035 [Terriglobia bacterium]
MFKKLRWPLLLLVAALTVLMPGAAMAERYQEHRDHVLVQVDVGHGFRHCRGGW